MSKIHARASAGRRVEYPVEFPVVGLGAMETDPPWNAAFDASIKFEGAASIRQTSNGNVLSRQFGLPGADFSALNGFDWTIRVRHTAGTPGAVTVSALTFLFDVIDSGRLELDDAGTLGEFNLYRMAGGLSDAGLDDVAFLLLKPSGFTGAFIWYDDLRAVGVRDVGVPPGIPAIPGPVQVVNAGAATTQRYSVQTIHGGVEDVLASDWPWAGGDSIEDAGEAYEGSWFRRTTSPTQNTFATYTGDGTPPDPTKPPAQDWTTPGDADHLSVRIRAAVLPGAGLTGFVDTTGRPRANISWELADGVEFVANAWQLWILPFSAILAASPTADLSSVHEIALKFPGFGPDSFDMDDFRVGFTRNVPILGVGSSVRAR